MTVIEPPRFERNKELLRLLRNTKAAVEAWKKKVGGKEPAEVQAERMQFILNGLDTFGMVGVPINVGGYFNICLPDRYIPTQRMHATASWNCVIDWKWYCRVQAEWDASDSDSEA